MKMTKLPLSNSHSSLRPTRTPNARGAPDSQPALLNLTLGWRAAASDRGTAGGQLRAEAAALCHSGRAEAATTLCAGEAKAVVLIDTAGRMQVGL